MTALPRPDLPAGPHRELNDALHELHHRAGWPSLRTLAGEAGCSHTTVSNAFSSPKLPTWGVLELIVEAMDGDTGRFHDLWLGASTPASNATGLPPRIAGRRDELAAVRRHLETGAGLLLVTGEAGIGKSKLVATAVATLNPETVVATGFGLPLSTDVPLLPIADLLRSIYEVDEQWFKEALADCSPYVAGSLSRLLPELEGAPTMPEGDDGSAQRRLYGAVTAMFSSLGGLRSFALLLEDLHWADESTLDVIDYLLATGRLSGVPMVGTFRTDDPDTSATWFNRVRRLPNVTTLALGPLTRDETALQLAQLTGRSPEPQLADRIHDRALGHPLFVEQLATQAADAPMPALLADLLDQRLEGLSEPTWALARALGIADRALDVGQLGEVTGCPPEALVQGIRALDARRLLDGSEHAVRLRHPLLAEAVRRRMVVAEIVEEHRRMAVAMARWRHGSAPEIAAHWKGANDPSMELEWRVRSAKEAGARFAHRQEADQWRRVIELWPDDAAEKPGGISLAEVYWTAMDAIGATGDAQQAATLIDGALLLLDHVAAEEKASLLVHVGTVHGFTNTGAAMPFLEEALAIYGLLPPSRGHVVALFELAGHLRHQGRRLDSAAVIDRAVEVSSHIDDLALHRKAMATQAWEDVVAGRVAQGLQRIETAAALCPTEPDPISDIWFGVAHTDIILLTGGSADAAISAGQAGLDASTTWEIDSYFAALLRANVAESMLRSGQVRRAGALIMPVTNVKLTRDRAWLYEARARIELLRGHIDVAADGYLRLLELSFSSLALRLDLAERAAHCDVWRNAPSSALERLLPLLDAAVPTELSKVSGPALCMASRTAADLARGADRLRPILRSRLQDLLATALLDPFAPYDAPSDAAACGATWMAEIGRLDGTASTELWVAAATTWDLLSRPHDSAYCRWRAAQVALATGEAGLATRLLRRAARDAREHVPLVTAIRETTA